VSDGFSVFTTKCLAAQQEINSVVTRMRAVLDRLEGEAKPLLSEGWFGAAADDYKIKQDKWNVDCAHLSQVLQSISNAVGDAMRSYEEADKYGQAQFTQ
jgi:WXG100 family type VII secretion target